VVWFDSSSKPDTRNPGCGEFEDNAFEGGKSRRVEMFDHFNDSGCFKPVQALIRSANLG